MRGAVPSRTPGTSATKPMLATWTADDLRAALDRFNPKYIADWQRWMETPADERPEAFVRTMGRWQATRPYSMRRLRRRRAEHEPPYIEDLIEEGARLLSAFDGFRLGENRLGSSHRRALAQVWQVFRRLRQNDQGSCVAISKAVLLLTEGQVGPALDKTVRQALGVSHVTDAGAWADLLSDVSLDVLTFEAKHGRLQDVVQPHFRHLASGRIYDMALGPASRAEHAPRSPKRRRTGPK